MAGFDEVRGAGAHHDGEFLAEVLGDGEGAGGGIFEEALVDFLEAGGVGGGEFFGIEGAAGDQVGVGVAVAVEVAPSEDDAGALEGQADGGGDVAELAAPVVEEEAVGGIVAADREVEVAVVVGVDEGAAGSPVGAVFG